MEYLKDNSYYEDLYDLFTVQDCLRFKSTHKLGHTKTFLDAFTEMHLYYRKGERYKNRSTTIQQWINRDTNLQNRYDSAVPPKVNCGYCDGQMDVIDKSIADLIQDKTQILIILECADCHKRMGIYEDGTRWHSKSHNCPKCSQPLTRTSNRIGDIITTKVTCHECGYTNEDILDLESDHKAFKEKMRKDRELLEKYRDTYCMNEVEGQQYVAQCVRSNHLSELLKKNKEQDVDPLYQKMKQIKIITVVEMEKMITQALEKTKYIHFSLNKPEIDKYVIVPFTVQESDSTRMQYDSIHDLQKIIKKNLKPTNWRLMSEGILNRSGYLIGKLKSYETEVELMKLIKSSHSEE